MSVRPLVARRFPSSSAPPMRTPNPHSLSFACWSGSGHSAYRGRTCAGQASGADVLLQRETRPGRGRGGLHRAWPQTCALHCGDGYVVLVEGLGWTSWRYRQRTGESRGLGPAEHFSGPGNADLRTSSDAPWPGQGRLIRDATAIRIPRTLPLMYRTLGPTVGAESQSILSSPTGHTRPFPPPIGQSCDG